MQILGALEVLRPHGLLFISRAPLAAQSAAGLSDSEVEDEIDDSVFTKPAWNYTLPLWLLDYKLLIISLQTIYYLTTYL